MAIEKGLNSKISDSRGAVLNKCIEILNNYRGSLQNKNAHSNQQLLVPDSLRLLPLYTLALIKNISLRPNVRSDERAFGTMLIRTLPTQLSTPFLYPNFYSLNQLPSGNEPLPTLELSSEKLDRTGAFLLDDGQALFMWIGRDISPAFLSLVFGVNSIAELDVDQAPSLFDQAPIGNNRVKEIVEQIRLSRPLYQRLYVIKDDNAPSAAADQFYAYLIHDRSKALPSYPEFLQELQRLVLSKPMK